jgi:hypothetical protein
MNEIVFGGALVKFGTQKRRHYMVTEHLRIEMYEYEYDHIFPGVWINNNLKYPKRHDALHGFFKSSCGKIGFRELQSSR